MSLKVHVFIAALIGIVASSLLWTTVPAKAHTWSSWMTARWATTDPTIEWRFMTSFPTGTGARGRVIDGSQEWNNLGQSVKFSYQLGSSDYDPSVWGLECNEKSYQQNAVHWAYIDGATGATVASAFVCSYYDALGGSNSTSTLHSFGMRFDKDQKWYTGTGDGTAIKLGEMDLWGTAAHEFGHVTGRPGPNSNYFTPPTGGDSSGHFKDSSGYCANDSTHHTMCAWERDDTVRSRTLETHDKDIFNGAY